MKYLWIMLVLCTGCKPQVPTHEPLLGGYFDVMYTRMERGELAFQDTTTFMRSARLYAISTHRRVR